MPNLNFYAADDDWTAVLDAVFDLQAFRVFESDSQPDHELVEFHTAAEAIDSPRRRHLMLFVTGSGPEPIARRIDFVPGVTDHGTFRYTCEGWGLV